MATFELTGADGHTYTLDAPDETTALAAFRKFNGGGNVSRETSKPYSVDDFGRSLAHGIPILGGAADNIAATMDAVTQPILGRGSDAPTLAERRAANLAAERARSEKTAADHPVLDTVGELAGGIGAMAPAVVAAPALFGARAGAGMAEKVLAGAASGGVIGAADTAVRGGDVGEGAALNAAVGGVAPVVGAGIGRAYNAIRGRKVPVTPQNTVPVAGVDVPVPPVDPVVQGEIEAMRQGGRGDAAKRGVGEYDALTDQRLSEANRRISEGLAGGAQERTLPQAAAETVTTELQAIEAQRAAAEAARLAQVDAVRGLPGAPIVDAGTAAERTGAALAAKRAAEKAATTEKYNAVRDAPGEFDPSMRKGVGDAIRERLNRGDDPLWVDPDTTSRANAVLKELDKTLGKGSIFDNAAAPRTGAVAGSEADRTLEQLKAMGINPQRAEAAVANMDGAAPPRPAPQPAAPAAGVLEPHDVALPDGKSVRVAPKVVEADTIKTSADPGYDKSLQPRDRTRVASDQQVGDMSRNLNPERLGASAEADRGAPIVGPDGMVESGNGRVAAIRAAYGENGASAQRYRDWLAAQGVDVSKYRNPVLVRERATPMTAAERRQFTVAANQSSTLSLSAAERALADARIVTPDSLALIKNPADLGSAENMPFIRQFMAAVPQAERGALMTADGQLSSEGLTRVRNAVLGKAYGDTLLLARIAESTTDDVKSISNALVAAAPEWAALRAAIGAGRVPAEMDATAHLLDAVQRTARARGRGVGLRDSQAQADVFTKQSPESQIFQRMFYGPDGEKAAPAAQVANALRYFAQEAGKVDAAPGLGLGLAPVTARDILESAAAKVGAPKELAKAVTAAAEAKAAAAEPMPAGITLREMDQARKRLVSAYTDAKNAAARGGDASDQRATAKILHEFDAMIIDALEGGKFSGDAVAARRLLAEARASHAAMKAKFSSRGPGDEVGRNVEKILGRYSDTAATPEEVIKLGYGGDKPGGPQATRTSLRIKSIMGETSPEWGTYKNGLVDHLLNQPGKTRAQIADRIDEFLTKPHGKSLAHAVLLPEERAALARHAANLRAAEPVPLSALKDVDAIVARISGRDGGIPPSTTEVVNWLYGSNGTGTSGLSQRLILRLKADMTPQGFNKVRQGMWTKLTSPGEGKIEWGDQKISQRLHEFLNESGKPVAKALYTPAELTEMRAIADAMKRQIPAPGVTNPSGTASMIARMSNKLVHMVLPLMGAHSGGLVGFAGGMAADKALTSASNWKAARRAQNLLYGRQPSVPVDPRFAKAAASIAQGAAPRQISGR